MTIDHIHLPSDATQRFIAAELQRFRQHAIPGAMNLAMLDGYFAALHSSPNPYNIEDKLEAIWGSGDLPAIGVFTDATEVSQFFTCLLNHWKNVAIRFEQDQLFIPLAFVDSHDGSDWAIGFLLGTEHYEQQWRELCNDAEHGDCTLAILTQAYLNHPQKELRSYQTKEITGEELGQLNQELIIGVNKVHEYFINE